MLLFYASIAFVFILIHSCTNFLNLLRHKNTTRQDKDPSTARQDTFSISRSWKSLAYAPLQYSKAMRASSLLQPLEHR
jgi:hypothetical protein